MHGLIVQVSIDTSRADEASKLLNEVVVPTVSGMPGFVAGYWLRSADGAAGSSVAVFESEEAAQKAADNVPRPPDEAPVTVTRFELMEVLATA